MKVYEYEDYDEYVKWQTLTNKEKLSWVYVREDIIKAIAKNKGPADNVLCHGTRSGAEQKYFKRCYPDAYIVGTEISDTAEDYPMTVQHDFTHPKTEWIGKFDIVYSNSFDHTIDPVKTLETWRNQLAPEGRLYLEYAEQQSTGDKRDPLDATAKEVEELLLDSGLVIIGNITEGVKHAGVVFICEAA